MCLASGLFLFWEEVLVREKGRIACDDRLRDKIHGCLLGVAVGDALGAPFEHLGPGETTPAIDRSGGRINDLFPYQGYPAGTWTDDTGMTLAACRAFIRMSRKGEEMEVSFRRAFNDWAGSGECRIPGSTVLYAAKYGKPDVNSWANGALMRTSPVAIYAHLAVYGSRETADLAVFAARLTHGHPFAVFPTVECVLALCSLFRDEVFVPEGLFDPIAFLDERERKRGRYEQYAEKRHADHYAVHPSTGLWMWRQVFEKCFGLREGSRWSDMPGFEQGILKAVNDSYDKDTAGAVAGALLGACWGGGRIPGKWKEKVEKADKIVELADELIDAVRS